MTARQYSMRLTEMGFPFRSDLFEKSALADEIPNAKNRRVVPEPIFMDNVIPSAQGLDSLDRIVAITGGAGVIKFDKVYDFFSISGQKYLFSPAYGRAAVIKDGETAWISYLNLVGNPTASVMYLRGETYFYFRNFGAYRYDEPLVDLVAVTLTGLIVANIIGVTSASNYAIAFDRNTIYFTSRIEVSNAIDFTPTLNVAGSAQVLAIRGNIVTCLPYANGFIIYTRNNAVMASYSGNPTNPFTFREIPGSAGVIDEENVAWDTNIGVHFAWTRSGMQQLSPDRSSNFIPELADYVRQRTVESLNEDTGVLSRTIFTQEMTIKLNIIAHRYLCFSYGQQISDATMQIYDAAFIFDLDLKRWGRLTLPHVDLFAYTFSGGISFLTYDQLAATTYDQLSEIRYEELTTQDPGGRNLGFKIGALKLNGQTEVVFRANLLDPAAAASGVMLLGRMSAYPENMTELQELRVSQAQLEKVKVYLSQYSDPIVAPSAVVTPTKHNLTGVTFNERYLWRSTARNHTILVKGRFHMTDFDLWLDQVGDR